MGLVDPTRLPQGQLPRPYLHLTVIGQARLGGQGAVYAVLDERSNARRALKVFHREHTPRPQDVSGLIEFGQRVPDHLFSRVYDVVDLREEPGWELFGFTMDFLDWSLARLLECADKQGWKFHASTVSGWVRQLAAGVEHLGETGFVHRDLKPANLGFRLPRAGGGVADIVPMETPGDEPDHFERAELVTMDLGTVAKEGRSAPAIQPNDTYKAVRLYGPGQTQVAVRPMDLIAFARLLHDFEFLTREPLTWLDDAARRCRDLEHPLPVGVLSRLVSPSWQTQAELYEKAGYSEEGLEHFVGREWVFKSFLEYQQEVGPKHGGLFLIQGPAGSGKSTFMREASRRSGQRQGFYFKVGARTTAESMVRAVTEQLKKHLEGLIRTRREKGEGEADSVRSDSGHTDDRCLVPDLREEMLENWIQLLLDRIAGCQTKPTPLFLNIDAMDETETPEEADKVVRCLPKNLHAGQFLIVSTRSPLVGWGYLTALQQSFSEPNRIWRKLEIDPSNPRNKEDVTKYIAKRLELGDDAHPDAAKLAERCGHLFLLADFQVIAIRNGHLTLTAALNETLNWMSIPDPADRLKEYYKSSWERITRKRETFATDPLSGIDGQQIREYVSVMLCVLGDRGIDEESVTAWLRKHTPEWTSTQVRTLNQFFFWFVQQVGSDTANPVNRVRHKSIRDYLATAAEGIPLSAVRDWHKRVAEHYLDEADYRSGTPAWENVHPYGKKHAVSHLLETVRAKPGNPEALENPEDWRMAADILTSWAYLGVCLADPEQRV